jgi:two-component system response regulator
MRLQTVLVVEDSEVEARMLERGLVGASLRNAVIVATTTTDAEQYLFTDSTLAGGNRPNPDLVVLDVKVPPAGGLALLQRMRADTRTKRIPVVMMSGALRDEDVQDLYNSGANSFLDKPVDFQEFISLIGSAARYWLGLNLNGKPSI